MYFTPGIRFLPGDPPWKAIGLLLGYFWVAIGRVLLRKPGNPEPEEHSVEEQKTSLSHRTTILGKLWNVTLNIRRIFYKEAKHPTLKELKLLIHFDCPHCHYASDGIVCSHTWLEFQLSCVFVLLRVSGCNSISDFCLLAQRLCKLYAGADRCETDRDLLFSGGLKPGFRQLRNSSKLSFQSAFSSESSIRASTQRLLWDTCRNHLYIPFRTTHFIQMWSQGSKRLHFELYHSFSFAFQRTVALKYWRFGYSWKPYVTTDCIHMFGVGIGTISYVH